MHTMSRLSHVEQTVVDTALWDHIRHTLKANELAGSPDSGEGKQVIQSTTYGREMALVSV